MQKVKHLICEFMSSKDMQILSKSRQKTYQSYLQKNFNDAFGETDKDDISKIAFKREVKSWLERLDNVPFKREHTLSCVKRFLNWCIEWEYIPKHEMKNLKFKIEKKLKLNAWSEDDLKAFFEHAPLPLINYVFVAVETGLRGVDLRQLKTEHLIDNEGHKFFRIKQSKTQKYVLICVTENLQAWLNQQNYADDDFILKTGHKKPWTEEAVKIAWRRIKKKLNLKNISLHGLRKTTVKRLMQAQATVPEISAFLGWPISTVNTMLDQHYFVEKVSLSGQAADKLNKYRNEENLNNL